MNSPGKIHGDRLEQQTDDPTQWLYPSLVSPNRTIHISNLERELTTQSTRIRELEAKVESLNGHEVMREYEMLFKAHPFYYKAEHTPLVNDCVALAWTAVRNILERATTTQKG